jgi:regulator of sigma E protease
VGNHEVEYVIAAIPLGGYVQMLDENQHTVPAALREQAFNRQSVGRRMAIAVAGPLFNFGFAVLAFWWMLLLGTSGWVPIIGQVQPGSIAQQAGLYPGLEITHIGQQSTLTWQQVNHALASHLGEAQLVLKAKPSASAPIESFNLPLTTWQLDPKAPNLIASLGLQPFYPSFPAVIEELVANGPAMRAGLQIQDQVLAINQKPVADWPAVIYQVQAAANQPLLFTIQRNGQVQELWIEPQAKRQAGQVQGYIGAIAKSQPIPAQYRRWQQAGLVNGLSQALTKTWEHSVMTLSLLAKMLTGKVGLETLSGPLTIAQGAGSTAQIGLAYYLGFLALISISLGVVNLLPIPMLDGGHLLFNGLEIILRRPLSAKAQEQFNKIGLMILMGLMALALFNDLNRW